MRRLPIALAVVLALAGCTSTTTVVPTPAPSPTVTAQPVAGLVPRALSPASTATATTEAKRLADAMQGLIPASEIVYVDDHGQYSAASGENPAFYGIVRVISIQPTDDPRAMAASLIQSLEASGWTVAQTTDQDGLTLTGLIATTGSQQWVVLLGSDTTVEGQSVINLQLASPDLP